MLQIQQLQTKPNLIKHLLKYLRFVTKQLLSGMKQKKVVKLVTKQLLSGTKL